MSAMKGVSEAALYVLKFSVAENPLPCGAALLDAFYHAVV